MIEAKNSDPVVITEKQKLERLTCKNLNLLTRKLK
jgi:hypothetical protein